MDFQSAGDLLGRRFGLHPLRRRHEGGFDKLKGKTIGLVHLDAPYGKEPIPLLEALAKDYGFNAQALSGAGQGNAEPDSLWLNVRRDRPDWIDIRAGAP